MTVESKEETVQVGDADLWTITQGAGQPLVLCHGGPGLWDDLEPVVRDVSDLVSVHRYDQRGGGRSSDTRPYSVSRFVEDLEALRRHWDYEAWILGGHSWGASLALAYAARYPGRVTSLLYISGTGLGWKWHSEYKAEVARRLGEESLSEVEALKERRRNLEEGSDGYAEVDRAICRIQWSTDFADQTRALELVESLIDEHYMPNYEVNKSVNDDWKRLSSSSAFSEAVARIAVPTLVIHGSGDPRPVSAVESLTDRLADARLAIIGGAGHFPWLEAPDEFRREVRGFVA